MKRLILCLVLLVGACGSVDHGNDSEAMLRNQAAGLSAQADQAANVQIEQINASSYAATVQPAAAR